MAARTALTCIPRMRAQWARRNSGCTNSMPGVRRPSNTERERAALAWTEALTLVSQTHVPDSDYDEVRKQFSEKEIVDLTLAISMINLWNRLAISLRAVPGRYKPATAAASAS